MDANELSDQQLLAYLDDEADAAITRRIESNPRYRQRLQALARRQKRLEDLLQRLPRPSSLELSQYHLGLLPPARAREIKQYLQKHPHAARQLEILDDFLADLEPDAPQPGLIERGKILIARLIENSDAWPQTAVSGIRGSQEGIYQADDIQIILQTDTDPHDAARKVLTGLVLGAEPQGISARLWQAATAQEIATADLDDFGNFTLPNLESGRYELILSSDEPALEIHIQEIEV